MSELLADLSRAVMALFAAAFEPGKVFYSILSGFLGIFGFHKTLYILVGLFFTRHFKPAKHLHKYAICIPARNEEAVIGNLIDSIHRQDYPAELITIFVVADNCTDRTAEIARKKGAICYEHNNTEERTKGFALKYLFEQIAADYGITAFEGYFIFDSDNLLNRDYLSRMNDSFDAGEKIITSYRNTKNFDENWIASTYALHWLRSIRVRHRARSVFRLATNIQGTGFLFANELVKDGWKYTSLTEDRAFTADAVAHGYAISYNDAAVFYDEQPTSLRIALRQRLRWSKGHLQAFVETGWPLFKNIFLGNCYAKEEKGWGRAQKKTGDEKRREFGGRFLEGLRHRVASFDTLAQLIPTSVIRLFAWVPVYLFFYGGYCYENGISGTLLFKGGSWLAKTLSYLSGQAGVELPPGVMALFAGIGLSVLGRAIGYIAGDIKNMFLAAYVFFAERKRLVKFSLWKKIFYCITFPVFDMIGRYTMYVAVFKKVTWKTIPHTSRVTIEDIEAGR